MVFQYRQKDLAPQLLLDRPPVDIKKGRIGRSLSVFQDINPPVVVAADTHVIWHQVQDLAHSVMVECLNEMDEVFPGTDLGVQFAVVCDVITMRTPRTGLQIRRGVAMAYTQLS